MSEAIETTNLTSSEQGRSTCKEKMTNCFTKWRNSSKIRVCIVAATWGFLTGVERAIILPTLWLYFFKKFSLEAAIHYYGSTLAAFNFAILIISPLYGYLAHKGIRAKVLIVVSNQLEIVGNIIYMFANQPWQLLIGRCIAGIGGGSEVPLYADIIRITSVEERTPYIASLLLARQFGLIIGPACTLFMENLDMKIGEVSISVYNGPGLVMAILWALHTILTLFIYPRVNKEEDVSQFSQENRMEMLRDYFYASPSKKTSEDIEIVALPSDINSDQQNERNPIINSNSKTSSCCNWNKFANYTKYETVVILMALFGAYFTLMCLEAVLPPVATRYFKWTEVQTSYVYLACGILVIFVYLVVRYLSKCCKDRTILIIGCGFLIFSYLWLMIILATIDTTKVNLYIGLIVTGIVFHVIGEPFVVCAESLYTKTLPNADMDVSQSILRTVLNLAILIGPFVGGSLQHIPAGVFAIMMVLIIIPTILIVSKFNKLNL